jgi:hypothetical protein
LWQESSCHISRGRKVKSPILHERNALYAFRVWSKCDCLGSTTVINVIPLKRIAKIQDFYKLDRMIGWESLKILYYLWKDLGEPFSWPSRWNKSRSEEPFVGNSDNRKGSFNSSETLCLLGLWEQSGGAWWLEKLTSWGSGYICPLWWFGSYFSLYSWQQHGRWHGTCPSGAIKTCCCAWGELLHPLWYTYQKFRHTMCQRLRSLVGLKELKVWWLQSLQYRKVHIEVYSISCVKRSVCLWKVELVNPEETWDS